MDTHLASHNNIGAEPHASPAPLLLNRGDIERLLSPDDCIAAVEEAFRLHATGKAAAPGVLGMHVAGGGFHIKAAALNLERPYFAAKLNANFPGNGSRHGLPTIQGVVVLSDGANGTPLAVMDSMAITALRTAAATAVAAKYLARPDCDTALLCGCGGQAAAQLRALLRVRTPRRILMYDQDANKAAALVQRLGPELSQATSLSIADNLATAVAASDIVITCTTAQRFFIARDVVQPGTFIAAVGTDSETKQEIDPQLLAHATVVVDSLDQCATIGDLHHALTAGLMTRDDLHASLGEIIAGLKPGRTRKDEVIVFDSTGTALQDVAAAAVVYRRAVGEESGERRGVRFAFAA